MCLACIENYKNVLMKCLYYDVMFSELIPDVDVGNIISSFGLGRFSVYSGLGLGMFSVYSGFNLGMFSVYSGLGLDRFLVYSGLGLPKPNPE
jgi:hypothetical protein